MADPSLQESLDAWKRMTAAERAFTLVMTTILIKSMKMVVDELKRKQPKEPA